MNKQQILTCGLNKQQKKAADNYRSDKHLNKTQSYMKAYPDCSKKSASQCASALFSLPKIRDYLAQFAVLEAREATISQEGIVTDLIEMKEKALGNKDMPIAKITKDGEIVQASVRNFDGAAAGKALELLGKHQKMFTDKVQLDGQLIVNMTMDLSGKREKVINPEADTTGLTHQVDN